MTSENNWKQYKFWAEHDFQINSSVEYSLKLKSPGECGTYLECHDAFSQLYKINVNIVRMFNKEYYFIQDFLHSETSTTIWLLFTGRENSNGYFELLIPTTGDHIEANIILQKMESKNYTSDERLIQKINTNDLDCEQHESSEYTNSEMEVHDEENMSTDKDRWEDLENENTIQKFLELRHKCENPMFSVYKKKQWFLKLEKFLNIKRLLLDAQENFTYRERKCFCRFLYEMFHWQERIS